jgi:hypothetical protein
MQNEVINKRQQRRLPTGSLTSSAMFMAPSYRVLDISSTGCLLESNEPLGRVASSFPLELPVPTKTDRPVVWATIVWAREGQGRGGRRCYRYGISFMGMDTASQRTLSMYLDYLQRDQHVSRLDNAWRSLKRPRTS